MQQSITRDKWAELFDLLSPFQKKIVMTFIDSLLRARDQTTKRDKRELLNISVWDQDALQEVADAQHRINQWQIPTF